MNAFEQRVLFIWIAFTILSIAILIPIMIWAVRSGQFSNNAEAGNLPLKSRIPENKKENNNVPS